jgi:hypothetical protein
MPSSSHALFSASSEQWRLAHEDLHIRNATDAKHGIHIEIYDDENCCHTADYQLQSDQSGCSVNLLQDGCYKVKATLDGQGESVAAVTVSDEPEQTIFIRIQSSGVTIKEGVLSPLP